MISRAISTKNWSAVNSLVVKDCCVSLGGSCGAVIASKTAMFNRGGFWEVWGKARTSLGASLQGSQAIVLIIGVLAIA